MLAARLLAKSTYDNPRPGDRGLPHSRVESEPALVVVR
jgi:hypothetical protein